MTIEDDLIRDEGIKLKPYRCPANKLTIGCGRNLDDVGITEDEARHLLANDIERVKKQLTHHFAWWITRPEPVQRAMMNMCFQLGIGGLLKFQKMLSCLHAGDYEGAKTHALDSAWARETPERAKRVTDIFTTPEA